MDINREKKTSLFCAITTCIFAYYKERVLNKKLSLEMK